MIKSWLVSFLRIEGAQGWIEIPKRTHTFSLIERYYASMRILYVPTLCQWACKQAESLNLRLFFTNYSHIAKIARASHFFSSIISIEIEKLQDIRQQNIGRNIYALTDDNIYWYIFDLTDYFLYISGWLHHYYLLNPLKSMYECRY